MASASGHEVAAPDCYLLVHNVVKKKNIGMMQRSCCAFNVKEMIVCGGSAKFATFGAQGTEKYMPVRQLAKLTEAVALLKEKGVTICGIEIDPTAQPVHTNPFRGPTAFFPGNEGSGLTPQQKAVCDHFVYIPQYGTGTASLNVATATAIVLQHYAVWAGYKEQVREEGRDKFLVEAPPPFNPDQLTDLQAAKRAARAAAGGALADVGAEADAEAAVSGFFDDADGGDSSGSDA